MRTCTFILLALTLAACGKSESPPAQPATSQTPATAATVEPANVPVDAVAAPTYQAPAATDTQATSAIPATQPSTETPPSESPTPPTAEPAVPAPATPLDTALTPPATEQAAPAATTPLETALTPPATEQPAPARATPLEAALGPSADAPYQVVDGHIDQNTVEGWKIYRGIGTCATCHGPVGQGGVGPALIESLKEKITKELFVETVTNGRDGTMMKPFGENPIVMENLDKVYAYLKARSDGVLGPENLIKYPLGKIE